MGTHLLKFWYLLKDRNVPNYTEVRIKEEKIKVQVILARNNQTTEDQARIFMRNARTILNSGFWVLNSDSIRISV